MHNINYYQSFLVIQVIVDYVIFKEKFTALSHPLGAFKTFSDDYIEDISLFLSNNSYISSSEADN